MSDARATVIADSLQQSSRGQVLLSGAKSIRFEYLRLSGSESSWLSSWADPNSPPRAVRVTLRTIQEKPADGCCPSWLHSDPGAVVACG